MSILVTSNSKLNLFTKLILLIIPCRGLIIIILNNKSFANIIYSITFLFAFAICLYGLRLSLNENQKLITSKKIRQLLFANLVLNIIWAIPIILFKPVIGTLMDPIYLSIFPFLIYVFANINIKNLKQIFIILTIVISGGILWDFIELNILFNRHEIAIARQELLRPEFESIGKNDGLFRPNGITGSRPHDAANLLSMFFVYWFTLFFLEKKNNVINILLILLTTISLLCTQVISNIIAAFFVEFIIILYLIFILRKNIFFKLLLLISPVIILIVKYPGLITIFNSSFDRAGSSGDWDGMFLGLKNADTFSFVLTFFIGHCGSLELSHAASILEFSILRMLFEYGIIHYLVIISLLLYPLNMLSKNKLIHNNIFYLPLIAVILVGIVSLWHYGSVLRITNTIIFWACYSKIIRLKEHNI